MGELTAFGRVNWRNIAITLIDPEKGEQKAHVSEIAWLQQLTSELPGAAAMTWILESESGLAI